MTPCKLSAKRLALCIDQANDDLGKAAEAKDVVFERALRWTQVLSDLGVTDDTLEAVFSAALAAKSDTFRLSIVELRQAARQVVATAKPALVLLPEFDELAAWETARAQVAALSPAEFAELGVPILAAAQARLSPQAWEFWTEDVQREHVAAVLARRFFDAA